MHALRLWTRPDGLAVRHSLHILAKVILASWPLTVPYVVCFFATTLRGRTAWIGIAWRSCREWLRPSYLRYRDPEAEAQYWKRCARDEEALQASNASTIPQNVPLVRYYVPKLLPIYRSPIVEDPEAEEYRLSARAYCKWHRMVFPGPVSVDVHLARVGTNHACEQRHPTLRQAEELVKYHSSRDRREMHRIARMLTDEEVFGQTVPWNPRYRETWRRWLDTKGRDTTIVFD